MLRKNAGFTLLEMLLVLLLMGTALGLVGLGGASDPAREARQQARGVLELLHLGQHLAVLEGREYGLCVAVGGVQLMNRQGQGWVKHGRGLSSAYDLHLRVEDRQQALGLACERPQVLLSGTEADSAFSLHLQMHGRSMAHVAGDGHNVPYLHE